METLRGMLRVGLVCLLFISAGAAFSADQLDGSQQLRYQALIAELRCLVCQNQNIADSNAPLAVDLREQVHEQIQQGRTDEQIKTYLVERYGDFVLYRPPLKPQTWLLWGGPFLLLACGLLIALSVYKRRSSVQAEAAPDPVALQQALDEGIKENQHKEEGS